MAENVGCEVGIVVYLGNHLVESDSLCGSDMLILTRNIYLVAGTKLLRVLCIFIVILSKLCTNCGTIQEL